MIKEYRHETRIMLEFSNKTRASYSRTRYGETLEQVVQQSKDKDEKVWNAYNVFDDYIEILYWQQSENKTIKIIIDKEDYQKIKNLYIQTNHNGYPQSRTNGKKQFLHRIIMNSDNLIDHIDRNPLNNRKNNLRFVNTSENVFNQSISKKNTSGVTGVSKTACGRRWRARIQFKGERKEKAFDTKEEAILQRKKWEKEIISQNYKQGSTTK